MAAPITGSCLCGAVTWSYSADPMFQAHCACDNCRHLSGAEHASFLAVPTESVSVAGETRSFDFKADSGATVTRHFCALCGTTVRITNERMPQFTVLPAGGLDDISKFTPQMFVYHAKAATWDKAGTGCATFEAMPPRTAA